MSIANVTTSAAVEEDAAEAKQSILSQDECAIARAEGHAEGFAEGIRLGREHELARFGDIARLCRDQRFSRIEVAANLALELPDLTAERCVEMAGRFVQHNSPAQPQTDWTQNIRGNG